MSISIPGTAAAANRITVLDQRHIDIPYDVTRQRSCIAQHLEMCHHDEWFPELLGSAKVARDAPQLYAPDKVAVLTGHETKALEEMIPPEVARLDWVTSVVTAPRYIPDVNTQVHVRRPHGGNAIENGTSFS
jgi:hypothetical protein